MSQSLDSLRNQIGPQLDLTLRIIQANGVFAEKIMASHFAMLHGVAHKASVPESYSSEHVWNALNKGGSVFSDYCKSCLRDVLDYQQQVLAALSRK